MVTQHAHLPCAVDHKGQLCLRGYKLNTSGEKRMCCAVSAKDGMPPAPRALLCYN
jgi:hypothetical protein